MGGQAAPGAQPMAAAPPAQMAPVAPMQQVPKAMTKTAPMSAVPEPKAKTPIVLLVGVAVACLLAGVLITVVVLKFLG